MKDKASGNDSVDAENLDSPAEDEPGIHVGDELSMDPEGGDLLDPVEDRWWDESDSKKESPEIPETGSEELERKAEEGDSADVEDSIGEFDEKLNVETESDAVDAKDPSGLLPPKREKRSLTAEPVSESEEPEEVIDAPGPEESERDVSSLLKKSGPLPEVEEVLGDNTKKKSVNLLMPKIESSPEVDSEESKNDDEEPDAGSGSDDSEVADSKPEDADAEEDEAELSDENLSESEEVEEDAPKKVKKKKAIVVSTPTSKKDDDTKSAEEDSDDTPEEKEESARKDSADSSTEEDDSEEESEDEPDKPLLQMMNENQAPVDLASAAASYAPGKKKAGCWTVFATLFFIATLLIVVALGVAAAIGWSKIGNLRSEVDTIAKGKLESQGIFLDYEDWAYQFPRGLVLQNVTAYESAERATPIVQVSDVGVNIDFVGLAKDRESLSGAELSFSDSNISVFEGGSSVMDLQGIDGEVLVDQERVQVERFAAMLDGLQVVAKGSLTLPEKNSGGGGGEGNGEEGKSPTKIFDFSALTKVNEMLAIEAGEVPPVLSVDFDVDNASETVELTATLNGRDFIWHGMPVTSAAAACNYDPATKRIAFTSFQVGYGEGFVGGVFSVATEEKLIEVERVQSTIDLLSLYTALKPEEAEKWSKIAFSDAPTVQISGTIPLDEPSKAVLAIDYEQRRGLIYTTTNGELPVSDIRGHVDLDSGRIETNDLAGNLLEGQVALNGTVNLAADGTPFSGLIEITRLPLANASGFFGKEDLSMSGDLYMNFRGVGYSEVTRIRGGGNVRVDEAQLPSFPVIGPVQEMIGQVIPAFQFKENGAVSGAYLIESGILLTNDFTIANSSANLLINGSVKLADQTTDFTALAALNKPLAIATGLEDKSIEVRGTGPLAEPTLTLRNFPVEFAAENLGAILGTTPETLGSLSQILGGQEDAAEVITGTIEEATGVDVGETVGAILEGLLAPAPEEADSDSEPEPAEPAPEPEPAAAPALRATVVEPE